MGEVVIVADHGSDEGSRDVLAEAARRLTGRDPVEVDARHFMVGGDGRVVAGRSGACLEVPAAGVAVSPEVVVVYEIAPGDRGRFRGFQRALATCGVPSLGLDAAAWRQATQKDRMVERFRRHRIAHTETLCLRRPTGGEAAAAWRRLGGDVWTRPVIGLGGGDVFHVTNEQQLEEAAARYAKCDIDWLLSRDARNFNGDGVRHQFRVVVLGERVLRVAEHVQADPDFPCNESQGAVSVVRPVDWLPPRLRRLAVAATRSLGLDFGGVDLAAEGGGVVFEVNVHPLLGPGALETVAVPYVRAHLALALALAGPGAGGRAGGHRPEHATCSNCYF